ncbi:MAG: 30S ribosome-binding factor RbfA [Opitutales bacterium]
MRQLRVNELLRRELGEILHTDYRDQTVRITITEVDVSPDLRNGDVYFSVIGGETDRAAAERFFDRRGSELRRKVARRVILKYLPTLRFHLDDSIERGNRTLEVLDELAAEENPPEPKD